MSTNSMCSSQRCVCQMEQVCARYFHFGHGSNPTFLAKIELMLRNFTTLFFAIGTMAAFGQQFSQVQVGRITATRSDSRSVNFIDINNDGWEDIFISNGLDGGQNDLLYLNDGTGRFNAVTNQDITNDQLSSVGASFADADNDGFVDGFVTNWYGQQDGFFQNDGNGSLGLVEKVIRKMTFAEAAAWGDYDNDGWLDLYVTVSAGSRENLFFRGTGDGNFAEVTTGLLVQDQDASRSVNWVDVNGDGWQDLFVGNEDNTANDLYINLGNGNFDHQTIGAGTTFTSSWADVDNDGDLDLFVGNTGITRSQSNRLLLNNNGEFEQILTGTVHTDGGCTTGSAFGDFDNDGDLDLIVTNGFCSNASNFLYRNEGDGTMIRADEDLPGLRQVSSYGAAWGDINNDGFLDLVVANCKQNGADTEPTNDLYQNNGNDNNWIKIKLKGVMSNRDAIGARVKVKASIGGENRWQTRQVSSQSGYSGQNSFWVHVGVGDAPSLDSVVVMWPSGEIEYLKDVEVNQHLTLTEGTVTSTGSIEFSDASLFRVWPNPVHRNTEQLRIDWSTPPGTGQITYQWVDTMGHIVSVSQGMVDEENYSLPNIVPGIYHLRAVHSNGMASQTIVVH